MGGVGVVACVVLSHMLDATELHIHVSCYASACARTVRIMHGWGGGWGGGGWAWLHALSCHTCWMLQNCTYMFHATQVHVLGLFLSCTHGVGGGVGGVGVVACVVLSHMLDATELHIHVSCYASAYARTVLIMHAWGGGWGGWVGVVACVVLSHMLVRCYRTAWGGGWGGGVGVVACVVLSHMLVRCYRTAWGGGGGWAWLHALSCHTCWMLQNCTYMFHATQVHVLGLFLSCTHGVGGGVGGWAWLHALSCHTC